MSIRFDTIGQRLDLSVNPSLATMTWMWWFYYDDFASDTEWPTFVGFLGGNAPCVQLNMNAGQMTIGENTYNTVPGSYIVERRWYHAAWVRAGETNNRLYLNGQLDIDDQFNLIRNGLAGIIINGQDGRFYSIFGCMAQHRIWDNALLTQAEIIKEMRSPIAVRKLDLWGDWPLHAGDGERVRDYSGNARNWTEAGTLVNGYPSEPTRQLKPPKIWWLGEVGGITFQYLRPSADTSLGSWTDEADGATNIYAHIDETSPSDADYVQSPNNPSANIYKFKISTGSDPTIHTNHIISYRYRKPDSTGTVNLKVRLVEGTTTRKEWTHNDIGTTWTTQEQTLTEGEAATITDYSNLYLELEAG